MARYEAGKEVKENETDFESFSLRIPKELATQINERRLISKRSKNMEITILLQQAIETQVEKDKEIIEAMMMRNSSLRSNQS